MVSVVGYVLDPVVEIVSMGHLMKHRPGDPADRAMEVRRVFRVRIELNLTPKRTNQKCKSRKVDTEPCRHRDLQGIYWICQIGFAHKQTMQKEGNGIYAS